MTSTRDRILDTAMRLFSEHGFRGTSITAIETEAGLSPGAGGIYHHFRSKQELLEAGLRRHMARLDALRDIRRVVGDLGDLRIELTIIARYVLAELDNEIELLRILLAEARRQPDLFAEATDKLIATGYADFSGWLQRRADPAPTPEQADAIAVFALGALFSSRFTVSVLGVRAVPVNDETLVTTWVNAVTGLLAQPPEPSGPS